MKWFFDAVAGQVLEWGVNWLSRNNLKDSEQLTALDNKQVQLYFTDFGQSIYFLFYTSHISVLTDYAGDVDAKITSNIQSLMRDKLPDWLGQEVKQSIQIEGDVKSAQAFQNYLDDIYIDWEEHLAQKIGDVPAHQFFRLVKDVSTELAKAIKTLGSNAREYVQEESDILPTTFEVEYFSAEVSVVSKKVDALQKRVRRLINVTEKD